MYNGWGKRSKTVQSIWKSIKNGGYTTTSQELKIESLTMECEYMGEKLGIGVLASGSGTDLQSIIDASETNMIDANVIVVITDKKDA